MKLTKSNIKKFEQEQKDHGTEVALHNAFWSLAAGILRGIGCTRIRTTSSSDSHIKRTG